MNRSPSFLIAMNLPQHDGCDPASTWEHSRNVTGPVSNWLFLNNGYHTAHHLWPARHWSELPGIHDRKVAAQLPPGLAWWQERGKGGSA